MLCPDGVEIKLLFLIACMFFLPEFIMSDYYKPSTLTKCAEDEMCEWLAANCPYLSTSQGRPVLNQSDVVQVHVTLYLKRLMSLNDLEQSMSVQGMFSIYWSLPSCAVWDQFLLQNVSESELSLKAREVTQCKFPKTRLWQPTILLTNGVMEGNIIDVIDNNNGESINVIQYGFARMFAPGRYEVLCDLKFRTFPFDTQTCYLELYTFSRRDESLLNLSSAGIFFLDQTFPGIKFVADADIWQLIGYNEETVPGKENIIHFNLTFKRKAHHYVLTIFIPLMLLMVLQISALIMPPKIPNRAQFAVTTVLTFQISEQVFTNAIPPSSQPVYLYYYIQANMALGVIITIYVLISCDIARRKTFKKPSIVCPYLSRIRFIDLIAGILSIVLNLAIAITFYSVVSYS